MNEDPSIRDSKAREYIASSYRYLRLGMVILVVTLAVSIAIERARATCWQGSISAYYYTPVHSLFVGALISIGVTLVAMKGKDSLEDLFFNVAGVLAPIVALVPTSHPSVVCSRPGDELTTRTTALVSNNVPALVVAVALAIVLAFVIARVRRGDGTPALPKSSSVVLVIGAVLLVAGFIWYQAATHNFERYAHGSTAVAMFVFIWFAVLLNGGWPKPVWRRLYALVGEPVPDHRPTDREKTFRAWYRWVAAFMFVAGLGVVLTAPLGIEWDHKVFWLEALEIAPFATFWTLQTFEAWNSGVESPTSVAATA